MAATTNDRSPPVSLSDRLADKLPIGYSCKIRYVHSPSKPCEPLFSALLGQSPEQTRLASHFLVSSVDPASLPYTGGQATRESVTDVISFAIEVLVYTGRGLTTLFVSKVDSTPYIPRLKPSPLRTTVTTFLQWLIDEERRKRPARKIVVSLFARAQAQYLFPGSSDDKTKHVLDDRQLIKWWARVLDPILPTEEQYEGVEAEYQGYMTVPGYAGIELRSFMPHASSKDNRPRWIPGNPLRQLARSRGLPDHAPPRCLLPRFPDDPKARFMQDLDDEIGILQDSQVTVSPSKRKSGTWKSVRDVDQFWEAMEFRQECSSGRAVGFLWLTISPKKIAEDFSTKATLSASNNAIQESAAAPSFTRSPSNRHNSKASPRETSKKRKPKPLTAPVIPRQPRLKGSLSLVSSKAPRQVQRAPQTKKGVSVTKEGYDIAMQTMLQQDFRSLSIAVRSTSKWVAEVMSVAGLINDFALAISGIAKVDKLVGADTAGVTALVNDLGGTIRKKRKVDDAGAASRDHGSEVAKGEEPSVNVLGAGMVRKKPKQ